MLVIVLVLCFACSVMQICMSIRLIKQTRELEKTRNVLIKLEDLNKRMSHELLNMADSAVLHDVDGIHLFYEKLLDLHHQFMAIEIE